MERSDTQPDEENQTETLAQEMEDSANERPERPAETKDLVTFWTKLDDVFDEIIGQFPKEEKLNKGNLKSFIYQPERISINSHDAQVLTTANPVSIGFGTNTTLPQETFSPFKIVLKKPLLNVKSIQLLSAIIPNPQASIPDNERYFTYYRLHNIYSSCFGVWVGSTTYARGDVIVRNTGVGGIYNYYISTVDSNLNNDPLTTSVWISLGQSGTAAGGTIFGPWSSSTTYSTGTTVFFTSTTGTRETFFYTSLQNSNTGNQPNTATTYWSKGAATLATAPNWFDISASTLGYVSLLPSTSDPQIYPASYTNSYTAKSAVFPDYPSLVTALNAAATVSSTASIAGDVAFAYNETISKIQFIPQNQIGWVNGDFNGGYYYLLVGWNDPNLSIFYEDDDHQQKPQYSLNLRCGFTWNGNFSLPTNPWTAGTQSTSFAAAIRNYFCPWNGAGQDITIFLPITRNLITANSYADLVYTQAVSIYCDVTQGSTQDSAGNSGLLSVIPMSTSQLGVTFYQNNFNNPLTKIPSQLQEITFSMKTQSGDDYVLPSSANVSFELAMEYHEK